MAYEPLNAYFSFFLNSVLIAKKCLRLYPKKIGVFFYLSLQVHIYLQSHHSPTHGVFLPHLGWCSNHTSLFLLDRVSKSVSNLIGFILSPIAMKLHPSARFMNTLTERVLINLLYLCPLST